MAISGSIGAEVVRAVSAEAGLAAAIQSETNSRVTQDQLEVAARTQALINEALARTTAINAEVATREAVDASVNARMDLVEGIAATTGGTLTSPLAFSAGAWSIADIGADAGLLTINTEFESYLNDGDYIEVSGTVAYNGVYGPVTVVAADEVRAPTTLPDTLHESVGVVASESVRLTDATPFLVGQWIEFVNQSGALHVSEIASKVGNLLHMTDSAPTEWATDPDGWADAGAPVTLTPHEIRLARVALPGSEDLGFTLPEVVRQLAQGNILMLSAPNDGVTSVQARVNAAITEATAQGGGSIHFNPGAYRLDANTTIPANVGLSFSPGAKVVVDASRTLTVNGPIIAGRWQIFDGLGSFAGTPKIDAAFPEWFGAAGVNQDIDTRAVQRAANFHTLVRGDRRTAYKINTQYQQWTAMDLHLAGRWHPEGWQQVSPWKSGLWVGVKVPNGTVIEDAVFELDFAIVTPAVPTGGQSQAEADALWRAPRFPLAFGFGDPTSASRHSGSGLRRCTFKNKVGFATGPSSAAQPQRPNPYVAQSIDGFFATENRFLGQNVNATESRRLLGPSYHYDLKDARYERNYLYGVQGGAVYEFSEGIRYVDNIVRNSRAAFDADKRDSHVYVAGNQVIYDVLDTHSTDPAFEFNGINNVQLLGNRVINQLRYALFNSKNDVYLTWADVMAQPNGNYSYTIGSNYISKGNYVYGTKNDAVQVGDQWDTHTTTLTSPASAGQPTVVVASVSGGDLEAEREAVVVLSTGSWTSVIQSIVGNIVTFYENLPASAVPGALIYDAESGNRNLHNGVPAGDNYFFEDEYVNCNIQGGQSSASATMIFWEGTGIRFGPGHRIVGGAAGPLPPGATYTLGSYGIYFDSTLEAAAAGAGTYSDLRVESFAGVIKDTPWEGVFIRNASRVNFSGLYVRNTGAQASGASRQVRIMFPESRAMKSVGELIVVPVGTVAEGVQIYSQLHKTGTHEISVADWTIKGHTMDLQLDSGGGSEGLAGDRIKFFKNPQFIGLTPFSGFTTTGSPSYFMGNGGRFIRWNPAHGSPSYVYGALMVPTNIGSIRAMPIRARVVGTATPVSTEWHRSTAGLGVGEVVNWSTTNVLETTATLADVFQDVIVARMGTLQAGEVAQFAFRPRAAGDANTTQDVYVMAAWVE